MPKKGLAHCHGSGTESRAATNGAAGVRGDKVIAIVEHDSIRSDKVSAVDFGQRAHTTAFWLLAALKEFRLPYWRSCRVRRR